jgi:hypothetical protein
VLETLAKHGARATFFLVAKKAEEHPELVKAILEGGHGVALHSWAHDRLFALRSERWVREDLGRGIAALEKLTGKRPTSFRPPMGHTNPGIARAVAALDLRVVGWTVSGHDGTGSARIADVIARVRRDLRDGAIVVLHDSPERGDREPAAVEALPAILDAIAAERLDVVALETWVDGVHAFPRDAVAPAGLNGRGAAPPSHRDVPSAAAPAGRAIGDRGCESTAPPAGGRARTALAGSRTIRADLVDTSVRRRNRP